LRAAMLAVREVLGALRAAGTSRAVLDRLISWEERQRLVGLPEVEALERTYVQRPASPDGEDPV
jgi:hypothetical protein